MTYRMFKLVFSLVLLMLATGCATKMTIHALEPAEIDRSASLKQIAILAFDESHKSGRGKYGINFAAKLEALLAHYQLDGESYFVVVSRSDLSRVIDEQKLQHSGLINEKNIAEIGQLTGAQALISGSVSSASSNDSNYFESRSRRQCNSEGRDCVSVEYKVTCTIRVIGLGVQIKMIDVERGDLVTAQSFNETQQWSACKDKKEGLPSPEQGFEKLSNLIAERFVQKIAPRYVSFDVTLLDDPDINLTNEQQTRFKAALEFIESNRLDRADDLLSQLHQDVQHQSYVIAYNLGVIKESEAAYSEAKNLYRLADRLLLAPVEEINLAVQRIDRLLTNQQRAQLQLDQ